MILKELKIMKMNAVAGGGLSEIIVPDGASSTLKAGRAVEGQQLPVMTIGKLDLGEEASLAISPESGCTKVRIEKLASAGASLVASTGAAVALDGDIVIESDPEGTGLTLAGDVVFGDDVTFTIPDSWRGYRAGRIVVLDGSEMKSHPSWNEKNITLKDGSGVIDSSDYKLHTTANNLTVDFRETLFMIVR
jgi:hypothetical protein